MSTPRDHRNIIRHIFLFLYILSHILLATAQIHTILDEKTLFMVTVDALGKPQFYSLDLTRSWDAVKAPLELLPPPPMELVSSALAVSYDKNSLLYFSSNRSLSTYNIATKTWQVGTPLPISPLYLVYGYKVAIDPSTGITYIPSKNDEAGVAVSSLVMCSFNTSQGNNPNITKTVVQSAPVSYQYFGTVWSTVRKSVLFYGGIWGPQPQVAALELMEYQPSNSQWATVKTQGVTTPGKFQGSCMASAYGGMKIVMFGNMEPPYSVFILDVKTLVWTKGPDPKPGLERDSSSCAVIGDYFIVPGGYRNNMFDKSVIVYNIKLNQWTDSYEAPHTPSVSTGVGNSSTTETAPPVAEQEQLSGGGMPLGAKIGIIAGGSSTLVILLTCGAFLIRRRKVRKSSQTDAVDKELPKLNLESAEEDKKNLNNDSNDSNDSNDNNDNNEINDNNDGNGNGNDNSDNSDNNDYTDGADKTGDNIQLRDILASLDYLTNRFDQQQQQQHGNQGEEAMFNGEVVDELYEDDPDYAPYAGEDMDPYSSSVLDLEYEGGDYNPYEYAYHPPLPVGNNSFPANAYISPSFPDTTVHQLEHDSNPHFNKSTLEPSENRQQQLAVLNKTLRDAPSPNPDCHLRVHGARNPQNLSSKASSSPSLDGRLKPQAARHPQHHSSSIPTVAVQQWQCAQQRQDPQYIPPPPSGTTKPAFAQYPRYDSHDDHSGYHDRLGHRTYDYDQCRSGPQGDRDHHHAVDYSTKYHDKQPNGPQVVFGTPNDDEDYLAMYQDPRMNGPQEHGHAFTEKDVSLSNTQHRFNPQDHTRHSTASHLEFYQARPYNNPQDHGNEVDQDDNAVYQEIQRIRAQQEEYMLQRQNLERVRIDNEAKLRTLADRVKYAQPRGQY